MRSRATNLALAGTLGLSGLVAGLVLAPAIATAATTDESAASAVGDRLTRIKDALAGLVSDGTLTQEQADRVATTLDENLPERGFGHGHRHGFGLGVGLDTAAEALGVTEDELRDALREGSSLADIAADQGVSVEDLTNALVQAAEERLAQAVEDGRLSQERADELRAGLQERIGELVEREGLRGPGGRWHHGPRGDGPPTDEDTGTPSPSSPSPSTGTSSFRIA